MTDALSHFAGSGDKGSKERPLKIVVGAITRRRHRQFEALMDSFAVMQRPDGAEVVFAFAENDKGQTVAALVEAFRQKVPESVHLALEQDPGIPFARNRVLDMALALEADVLTFVDDDEVVRPDWLVELIGGLQTRGLDLAGGPVLTEAQEGRLTNWNRAVLLHLQDRRRKFNRLRAAQTATGEDGGLNLYTNNWALRLSAQKKLDIRFDESLRETGGSDTALAVAMRAAGAKTGWVPDAKVEERVPAARLTLGYHYARARDQASNGVVLNAMTREVAMARVRLRLSDAVATAIAIPVLGRRGVVKAVHKWGLAVGHWRGLRGARSQHYSSKSERYHTDS